MLLRFTKFALFISLTSLTIASADEMSVQASPVDQSVQSDRQPLSAGTESFSNDPVPDFSESALDRFNRYFQESPEWVADSGEEPIAFKN